MIVVWVLLDTGNQIIHQALGRNSHHHRVVSPSGKL